MAKNYPTRFVWHKEPLNREKIAEILKRSEILIQPSRYEAFGMTVIEAMACGTAVITSNNGGLTEVVGNAGITIPLNVKMFIKKTEMLIKNYKLRERYARRGFEKAKTLKWGEIANKTLEIYYMISNKKELEPEKVSKAFENLDKIEKVHN